MAGIRAFIELPIEAFPDVQDVQVQVITQVVGQAPEEVERSVTIPIEREMSGIPQMTQLRSVSITGLSVITMIFADGTEDRLARAQVLEKLQTVDLPDGVTPTLGPLTTAVGEIYRYVVDAPPNLPLYEVRAIQDWIIRPELRRVPGVADVVGFGGSVKEIQVDVDPNALRKFGLTLDQVSQALRENNANTGGGIIRRGGEGLVLRAIGLFHTVEDVAATVIMSHEGKAITVGDVATIEISGHTPLSGIVSLAQQGDNGKILSQDSIVEGIVLMIKGSDPSKIIQTLNADYAKTGHAYRIEEIAGGYQMLTLPEYNTWLRRLRQSRQDSKLSPAAMETLAVVAYKQPVVRAEIEAVRGVSAGEVLNRLRELGLIKIVGRAEDVGRPMLYGTTKHFLELFGLGSLEDLPAIEELQMPK